MTIFRAVWPITDDTIPFAALKFEAEQDLPAVAARHGATITGPATFKVVDGRTQSGSQGAAQCVVATAPAMARKRNYGWIAA
ncbi:MAG TPA: hypothetical protein DCY59_11270 [Micrococcaceae bacterium]|nr:hypothetical protein [Micrococcaceae bacterium]